MASIQSSFEVACNLSLRNCSPVAKTKRHCVGEPKSRPNQSRDWGSLGKANRTLEKVLAPRSRREADHSAIGSQPRVASSATPRKPRRRRLDRVSPSPRSFLAGRGEKMGEVAGYPRRRSFLAVPRLPWAIVRSSLRDFSLARCARRLRRTFDLRS